MALRGYRVDGPDPDEALAAELDVYAQQAECAAGEAHRGADGAHS